MQAGDLHRSTGGGTGTRPWLSTFRLTASGSAWLKRLGYATAAWSLFYACLGLYWALGGAGFPFGAAHDPDPAIPKGLSILSGATQESGAPVIVVGCALGVIVALFMAGGHGKGIFSRIVVALAATGALLLAVIIPDSRPMIAAGHIPILLIGKPFGWPEGVSISSQLPWPVLNQGILIVGGLLFGTTALFYRRHVTASCHACGRRPSNRSDPGSAGMNRLGFTATWMAALLPALYALTRWAYALGIPLGVSSEFLREMERENPGI